MATTDRRWIALLTALVPSLALLTVLRHTRENLQADGVMQSVMSLQDPTLFFWGQDRFVPVVSWLTHPIADPGANLWACLVLEAAAFHGLLLVLARLATPTITDDTSWRSTTIVFLALTAAAGAVLTSPTIAQFAIDTQPYSPSFLAALGAFVLWRRGGRRMVVGGALVVLAVGLNPTAILALAALGLADALRTGLWRRWLALGVICVASQLGWTHLASVHAAPVMPEHKSLYAAFSLTDYPDRASLVVERLVEATRLPWLVVLAVVAAVLVARMPPAVRRTVLLRGALVVVFAAAFTALFAGNAWVAANVGHPRYFLPVFLAAVLVAGVPAAWLALQVTHRNATPLVLGAAVLAIAVTSWGPLVTPPQADVLTASAPVAEFASSEQIHFIAGDYWTVWPTLLPMLDEGRYASVVTTIRSGSDPGAYRALFERTRTEGPPRAVCIDAAVDECAAHLARWTAADWAPTGEACPDPVVPRPVGYESPIRQCLVLQAR